MATQQLNGKRVAILATDGVEQVELERPRQALLNARADAKVVTPNQGKIKGWDIDHWGDEITVDISLDEAYPDDFDARLQLAASLAEVDSHEAASHLEILRKREPSNTQVSILPVRSRRGLYSVGCWTADNGLLTYYEQSGIAKRSAPSLVLRNWRLL